MDFQQAKRRVVVKRIAGAAVAVPALISTVVSLLNMLYFRIDDGTALGSAVARPLKSFAYWAYENTHHLIGWFWSHSPTPDHMNPATSENAIFIGAYLLIFVGAALYASGNKLARRLRVIREQIENQVIAESIKGRNARSREQIEAETEIPQSSIFSQFHSLYLAPIVVGVVLALLLKLLGV